MNKVTHQLIDVCVSLTVSKCVCHAVEQALQEQVSSLLLSLFKKFKKQDEQSLWEWVAEQRKAKKVYCYLTIEQTWCVRTSKR